MNLRPNHAESPRNGSRQGLRSFITVNTRHTAVLALCLVAFLPGCRQDMHDQPKVEPLESSTFFDDKRSARPAVEGAVARGHLQADEHLYTGRVDTAFAETFPFPVTDGVLARGQERFNIYCTPCHDGTGSGAGMIVERGYPQPSSFHEERLHKAPVGYFFSAITNGFGVMPSYRKQVPAEDRWAIIAYIRALQLSRKVPVSALDAETRNLLEEDDG